MRYSTAPSEGERSTSPKIRSVLDASQLECPGTSPCAADLPGIRIKAPQVNTTEIFAVKQFSRCAEKVSAFCIDRPSPGTSANVYDFDCAGWVLARQGRCLGVELVANDGPIRRIPIAVARPDVRQRYPAPDQDNVVGFWSPVSVLGMTEEFELRVDAVFDDQMRVPLGQIQGRHRLLPKNTAPYIQPLILT